MGMPPEEDTPRPRSASIGPTRNFVSENSRVPTPGSRPRSSSPAPKFSRDDRNVPKYLERVKRTVAEEERAVARQLGLDRDPSIPHGHRLLSDDERQEIL